MGLGLNNSFTDRPPTDSHIEKTGKHRHRNTPNTQHTELQGMQGFKQVAFQSYVSESLKVSKQERESDSGGIFG